MNILFFTCWYPSRSNSINGLFIKNHAAAIKASGINITVLFLNVELGNKIIEKSYEQFIDENDVPTHIITIRSKFYKWIYINPFLMYRYVSTYLSKQVYPSFKPQIIHSNILNPASIIGHWLAVKLKVPHIITEHWSKVDKYMNRNVFSFLGRKAYNNAIAVTVVSNFLKNKVSKYVSNKEKIKVIPNVVDCNVFKCKPKTTNSNELIFCAIGNWKKPKQPRLFFEALEKVSNQVSQKITLKIIGNGPLLDELKQYKWNFLVEYMGNKSREDVATILQQADFFLHASEIETFSVVVAEALVSGIPVVASNVGALPELIDESNGVLCNNSTYEWEKRILQLLKMNYDRHTISKDATNKFNADNVASLFNKIYSEIAN